MHGTGTGLYRFSFYFLMIWLFADGVEVIEDEDENDEEAAEEGDEEEEPKKAKPAVNGSSTDPVVVNGSTDKEGGGGEWKTNYNINGIISCWHSSAEIFKLAHCTIIYCCLFDIEILNHSIIILNEVMSHFHTLWMFLFLALYTHVDQFILIVCALKIRALLYTHVSLKIQTIVP